MNEYPEMTCICCRSRNFKTHLSGLVCCPSCSHVMADMDVTSLNSKDIYSIDYFQQGEYLDYIKDRACFEKNFQKRIKSICQYRSSGRLLEIGSASGFFLNLANKHFESTGYEICEEMAAYAKNNLALNIKSVDFLQDNISPNHYDIAVMWDCIEHLAHPDHFLKKIHSGLKKGGVIALTTGDIGSFMAKVQGHKWRLIHPPTHVHYFTRQSMAIFLKNHGFEILKIQYPGFYRSFRQMFYGLFVNKKSRLWDSINTSPWAKTPFYLNFFDIMLVIARKI